MIFLKDLLCELGSCIIMEVSSIKSLGITTVQLKSTSNKTRKHTTDSVASQ